MIGITWGGYLVPFLHFLFSPLKGKLSALTRRRGISTLLMTIIIVGVIAGGAVIIYLVVVSGYGPPYSG